MQNLRLTWPGDSSATYEIQYKKSTDSSWTIPSGSPVVGTTLNVNGLDDNTGYNFRLRVLCGDSIGSWLYSSYTTTSSGCAPITGISISNITENGFYVSWSASVSAIGGYIVQYRKQGNVSWLSSPNTTSTTISIGGLDSGSTYDVRVLGFCASSTQSTSAVTTVTYAGGTVSDAIISPIIGTLMVLVYDSGTTTWY